MSNNISKSAYIKNNYKNFDLFEFLKLYKFTSREDCLKALSDTTTYLINHKKTNKHDKKGLKRFNTEFENLFKDQKVIDYFRSQALEESSKRKITGQFLYENSVAEVTFAEALNKLQGKKRDQDNNDNDTESLHSNEYHPRRTNIYEVKYPEKGKNIGCDTNEIKWIVNGVNINEEMNRFRSRSIHLAEDNVSQLSDLRLLSLDHIYLFTNHISSSFTKYLGLDLHNSIVHLLGLNNHTPTYNDEVYRWCQSLVDVDLDPNKDVWSQIQAIAVPFLASALSLQKHNLVLANMLHTLASRLHLDKIGHSIEDTLVHTAISFAIKHIFCSEQLLEHHWANSSLDSSDDTMAFKPDYVAYIKSWKTRMNLVADEFKAMGRKNCKPPSDLVNLAQQMKCMLNKLIQKRVSSPVACGILVEGHQCSTFKMNMVSRGFYRLVRLKEFCLCGNKSDILLLPAIASCIEQVKNIVMETARQVEKAELKHAKGKRSHDQAIPTSWIQSGNCVYTKKQKH